MCYILWKRSLNLKMEYKFNCLSLACTIVLKYIICIDTFRIWNSLLNGVIVFTETNYINICVSKYLKTLKRCLKTVLQLLKNITYISNKKQTLFLYFSKPSRRGKGSSIMSTGYILPQIPLPIRGCPQILKTANFGP